MDRSIFRLVALDEGGVRGTPDNLRLVCITDRDEKIAIWGKQDARRNIDAVLTAGIPCTVDTEWREPGEVQARKFGHRYWVRGDFALTVRASPRRPEPSHHVLNVDEPDVAYPEETFEAIVLKVLHAGLSTVGVPFCVVPHFGLDAAIFIGDSAASAKVLFVEAKSYGGQRVGGVGFGNGRGEGPQVDILLADPPGPLDASVRWAFVDATQGAGSARYALLDCHAARETAMGGVAHGKQNNFRISSLAPHFVLWAQFCERLLEFVGAARGGSA
jgi:hypothetical protein